MANWPRQCGWFPCVGEEFLLAFVLVKGSWTNRNSPAAWAGTGNPLVCIFRGHAAEDGRDEEDRALRNEQEDEGARFHGSARTFAEIGRTCRFAPGEAFLMPGTHRHVLAGIDVDG